MPYIERETSFGQFERVSGDVVLGDVLVPYANLLVWSDELLAAHGLIRQEEEADPLSNIPASISDRQFFQQLAIDGKISEAEAMAAVKTGDIPAVLEQFIETLAPGYRFGARMLLSGATSFEFAHPMTGMIGAAQGMNAEQVGEFFQRAATL